jgi:predicted nucleotidyltransferase
VAQLPLLAREAAGRVRQQLQQNLGERLLDVQVFGSQARGEAHENSDLDLLVLVDREEKWVRDVVYSVVAAVEAEINYRLPISPCLMSQARYQELLDRELLFGQELKRDAISV